MDWTRSGRTDSFRFETVDFDDLERVTGVLTGVTGGNLTWSYYGATRVSGSVELSCDELLEPGMLRVTMVSELDGETEEVELATCFMRVDDMTRSAGRWKGTIELRSALTRFSDDQLRRPFQIAPKEKYRARWKKLFSQLGGTFRIEGGVSDAKSGAKKAKVFDAGESPLKVLNHIAGKLGGRVDVDSHGRVLLRDYALPSKRPCTYVFPEGEYSVTMPDLGYSDSLPGTVNRVSVSYVYQYKVKVPRTKKVWSKKKGKTVTVKLRYTKDTTDADGTKHKKGEVKYKEVTKKKTLRSYAHVSKASPLHRDNCGVWVTKAVKVDKLSLKGVGNGKKTLANYKAALRLKAKELLVKNTKRTRAYELDHFWLPIEHGQVVQFSHDGVEIQGMVQSIDMDLAPGGRCKTVVKRIREA